MRNVDEPARPLDILFHQIDEIRAARDELCPAVRDDLAHGGGHSIGFGVREAVYAVESVRGLVDPPGGVQRVRRGVVERIGDGLETVSIVVAVRRAEDKRPRAGACWLGHILEAVNRIVRVGNGSTGIAVGSEIANRIVRKRHPILTRAVPQSAR